MKDFLTKMINDKKAKLVDIQKRGDVSQDVNEVRSLGKEMDEIRGEITEMEAQLAKIETEKREKDDEEMEARGQQQPQGTMSNVGTFAYGMSVENTRSKEQREKMEERGRHLMEGRTVTFTQDEIRAVTVASGDVLTGTHTSSTLNEGFDKVSSLVDAVNGVPLIGASAHEKGFHVDVAEAGYRADETAAYSATPNRFEKVSISSTNITAYDEISKSARVLTPVDYQSAVADGVRRALRKKMAREILQGTGNGQFRGIYNSDPALPLVKVLEVQEDELISANLLNKIVFSYGGDQEIELGYPVLILNKLDLAEFANLRGSDGKQLYKITLQGNTGTISSDGSYNVKFIINAAANSLKTSANDALTMVYGNPKFYEMPIFSQVEVKVSEDAKFQQGMLAVRADVYAGGSAAAHQAFTVVKRVASV